MPPDFPGRDAEAAIIPGGGGGGGRYVPADAGPALIVLAELDPRDVQQVRRQLAAAPPPRRRRGRLRRPPVVAEARRGPLIAAVPLLLLPLLLLPLALFVLLWFCDAVTAIEPPFSHL